MRKVTVSRGDGIGPEIMDATLRILNAAGAQVDWEEVNIGEQEYLSGNTSGISPKAWESVRSTKVFLKAPITTPQGGGYKSLNVTLRKTLGLMDSKKHSARTTGVVASNLRKDMPQISLQFQCYWLEPSLME